MSKIFITKTSNRGLSSNMMRGSPLYMSYATLMALLKPLGPDCEQLFARPAPDNSHNAVDWFSEREGTPVPLAQLSEADRSVALAKLEALKAQISNKAVELQGNPRADLLRAAIQYPNDSYVFVVNGAPVISCWGFRPSELKLVSGESIDREKGTAVLPAAAVAATESQATPVMSAVTPAPTASVPKSDTKIPVTPIPKKSFHWNWRKWWWLLPLLLLLLLLPFLLRGCGSFGVPSLGGLPDVSSPRTASADPVVSVPAGETPVNVSPELEKIRNVTLSISTGIANDAGEPVKLTVSFTSPTDGFASIEENDQVCTGKAAAEMDGNEAALLRLDQLKCPNGNHYEPTVIRCVVSGDAECASRKESGDQWEARGKVTVGK